MVNCLLDTFLCTSIIFPLLYISESEIHELISVVILVSWYTLSFFSKKVWIYTPTNFERDFISLTLTNIGFIPIFESVLLL